MLVLIFEGQSPLLHCSHPLHYILTTTDVPVTTTLSQPRPLQQVCMLHTWPCRGPSHHACLSSESFLLFFCFAFSHSSLSALLVLFPRAASPDVLHTTSSPPASSAMSMQRHPVWCVNAPVPHFYYRL